MNVQSRAHRILTALSRYSDLSQAKDTVEYSNPTLQKGEEIFGLYANKEGSLSDGILVSNLGVRVRRQEQWRYIPYLDIESVKVLPEQKRAADRILVVLKNGEHEMLPVEGGSGKFRDVFEFLRFIIRVLDDMKMV